MPESGFVFVKADFVFQKTALVLTKKIFVFKDAATAIE